MFPRRVIANVLYAIWLSDVDIHRVPTKQGHHVENFCWCLLNKPKYATDLFHQYSDFLYCPPASLTHSAGFGYKVASLNEN